MTLWNYREVPGTNAICISSDRGGTRLVQWLPDELGDVEDDLEILSALSGPHLPAMAQTVLFSHA